MRERKNVEGVARGTPDETRPSRDHRQVHPRNDASKSSLVRVTRGHGWDAGIALDATLATYCSTCETWREVKDWHESGDAIVIELEVCGHLARRTSRLEWLPAKNREHAAPGTLSEYAFAR